MNKVKKFLLAFLLVLAGAALGSAAIAYASTHTLQFVETPTVQLYQGESFNATCLIVTPVPEDLDSNVLTIASFGSNPTLTVDPGLSGLEEIEGFTSIVNNGNGTASLCGLTRDLASQYPYTTVGTGRAHAAGATVVFSNNPQMYARFAAPENTQTWTAVQTYASTSAPVFDVDPGAAYYSTAPGTTLIDLAQLNRTSIVGASNASLSTQGLVQVGTARQAASSTVTGSTGAYTAITTSIATDTPQTGCASGFSTAGAGCTVIAQLNGFISQSYFGLTRAFNFTGGIGVGSTTPVTAISVAAGSGNIVAAEASTTYASTVNINFGAQQQTKIELNGNITINMNNTALVPGATQRVVLCQDGTGSRTVTWNSSSTLIWAAHVVPTITATANECDIFSFLTTGATGTVDVLGAAVQGF